MCYKKQRKTKYYSTIVFNAIWNLISPVDYHQSIRQKEVKTIFLRCSYVQTVKQDWKTL